MVDAPTPAQANGHAKSSKPSADAYSIRPACPSDARPLVEFGRCVFTQCFGHAIAPKDLQTYLDESYTVHAFERDLNTATKHFWVAERQGGRAIAGDDAPDASNDAGTTSSSSKSSAPATVVGFIQVHEKTTERCLPPASDQMVEINRLYLHPSTHGTGLAHRLIGVAHEWARERGCKRVWLGVLEQNVKAKRFYEKCGYGYLGKQQFRMGEQWDTDEMMLREL